MSQQQKQDIQILQPFLKELPQGVTVRHIKRSEASSKQENVKSTRVFRSDKNLGASDIQLYQQLQTKSNELGDEIEQDNKDQIKTLIQTLVPKYSVGSQLQKVIGIEKITFGEEDSFTKEESSFQTENGVVYLIDVWATWCGPCQGPMEHNQKMLEKNPDWSGKVKIVGISVDDETEDVTKRVNTKKWKSIEHYRLLKGWDDENDLIKFLQLRGIPFVLLVNKWGKIVYMGHPSKANLEERINSEINAEQDTTEVKEETQENKQQTNEQLLSKEEYKQLKDKLVSIQTGLKESAFQGIVNVSLEKINVWKSDGTKEVLKRSKLTISYDIDVSEEEKLNKFLENHWNTVPENLRHVKEAKVRDPVRQQKEIKAKFQEAFAALGVTISYPNQDIHTYSYDTEKQELKSSTTSGFQVEAQNLTSDVYKSGMENLKDYLSQFEEEEEDEVNSQVVSTIVSGLRKYIVLGVGKQFETIENYKKWGSEEYTSIEHKPGQVLLLDYWAKWCGPCVREIEKNTKLLKQKAEQWGNDVRVVSLSLVLADEAKEFMESHQESQKFIEFYFPKEQKQPDAQKYGVQYIPHYVVVDKFGTIRKIASVDNVEKLVTSLLSEQAPQAKEEPVALQIDPTKVQEILNSSNAVFAQADPQKILQLEVVLKSKTNEGVVTISKPEISYFARDTQELQLQPVFSQLFNIVPEAQWSISKKISKTVSIPYPGKECALCKKDITQEPQQYYSPFKSEHICTECAEADDQEKKGNQRYKYLDTLVFINGPLSDPSVLENIDDHKLGSNMKLEDGEEGSQSHPMMCNGCGQGEKGPRYISITARPGRYRGGGYIDYCQKCFLQLKDKASEKAQEIVAKDVKDGMVLDSLFTRVLFNHGGYTDF